MKFCLPSFLLVFAAIPSGVLGLLFLPFLSLLLILSDVCLFFFLLLVSYAVFGLSFLLVVTDILSGVWAGCQRLLIGQ